MVLPRELCIGDDPWSSHGRRRLVPVNLQASSSRPALRLDDLGEHHPKVLHDDERDGATRERCGRHLRPRSRPPRLLIPPPPRRALPDAEPPPPAEPKPPSFDDLGLHPDVKLALDDMGYFSPTPVQTAVFKPVSEGKDLLVQSRTGTGKTTAFGLPIINKLIPTHRAPQALILAPTRELALQVARELTQHRQAPRDHRRADLRRRADRQADHGAHATASTSSSARRAACSTTSAAARSTASTIADVHPRRVRRDALDGLPRGHRARRRRTCPRRSRRCCSRRRCPTRCTRYARRHMRAPEQISLSRDSISVTEIHHAYYIVSGIARSRDLLKILFAEEPESAIIFCNMRDETTMVAKFLQKQGLDAEPLSSDLSQSDRERVMGRMKAEEPALPVRDRRRRARHRHLEPLARHQLLGARVARGLRPPHRPHRPRRQEGHRALAGRPARARQLPLRAAARSGSSPRSALLPKDDIFVGKLKVPLPPVGMPQPPDPVQILIRGVPGDAERPRAPDLREAARDGERQARARASSSPRSSTS